MPRKVIKKEKATIVIAYELDDTVYRELKPFFEGLSSFPVIVRIHDNYATITPEIWEEEAEKTHTWKYFMIAKETFVWILYYREETFTEEGNVIREYEEEICRSIYLSDVMDILYKILYRVIG